MSVAGGSAEEVRLVNLTPHPINIMVGGRVVELPAADSASRLVGEMQERGSILVAGSEIPVVAHRYSRVDDLPPEQDGVRYVVSQLVLDFADDRSDLLTPTDLVRDPNGNVIGCRALARRAD